MTKAEEILGGFVAGSKETGLVFHCARCGEELTDPASIQHSWGPWCRQLANAALATTIPADTETTLAHIAGVLFKAEPLTLALAAVSEEIVQGAANGRADWRGVVNVLTRLIAYSTLLTKAALCNAVESLGYTTLAAVARKEASPSAAEVTVVNNRLVLKTKRNKAANVTIKNIAGRRFHTDSKTWSFPPTEFRAVMSVVAKYFPMTKLDLIALATEVSKAVNAVQAAPVTTAVKNPGQMSAMVTISPAPGGFNVVSPYNAAFVADLKTSLPYKARSWNGAAKCWWVAADSIEAVKLLVAKHYGVEAKAA